MIQYLTPKQVAERLQLVPETIRQYCKSGVFPNAFQAVKGGAWRIPESDLERHQQPPGRVEVAPGIWLEPRSRRSQAMQDASARRRLIRARRGGT
ncbi:hypothetical protein GCM10009592_29000 [Brachybacterium rhamnosum]|uniref:Helix-turn-helix domain-containing protein n=1 Tax=Brachybacterium rhamnosum TaxID=173361 RepID=A0ABW4Q404_9MICO